MTSRSIPLLLAVLLSGCVVTSQTKPPQAAPESTLHGVGGKTVLPSAPQAPGQQPADAAGFPKHIVGHVYLPAGLAGSGSYRVEDVSEKPGVDVTVEVHPFGNAYLVESARVGTDANGAFSLGTNETKLPLFLQATVKLNGETTLLFAPVPNTPTPATVTVDIDLASTMLADYIFNHGGLLNPASPLLDPATVGDLRQSLHTNLSDQNAPDPRNPTQLYNQLTSLIQKDAGLKSVLDKTEAQVRAQSQAQPAAPVPSPTTIVPGTPVIGPAQGDPPIFGGNGPQVTASPKPASYLNNVFTALQAPGAMAAIRFKDIDQVFMAAIDHKDNSLFVFFRDTGSPTHLPSARLPVGASQGLALDANEHLYVVGPSGLARLTMAAGATPQITATDMLATDAALAGAAGLAIAPDASAAYVACQNGDVLKFALPAGTRDARFKGHLDAGAGALAAAPGGTLYVAGSDGAIARLDADGSTANPGYAKLAGVTSLSLSPQGSLYVGTTGKQVMRVRPGQAPETFLTTADAVTGVSCLGGYLYLTESSGVLDSLTTAE